MRRRIHGQGVPMEGGVVVLGTDKMQVEEDNQKRDDVAREPIAEQLSSRNLMTKSP